MLAEGSRSEEQMQEQEDFEEAMRQSNETETSRQDKALAEELDLNQALANSSQRVTSGEENSHGQNGTTTKTRW